MDFNSNLQRVSSLEYLSTLAVVSTLLNNQEHTDFQTSEYVQRLLETECFTAVSQQILFRLIEFHPSKLTNELLSSLVPVNSKDLDLSSCNRVSLLGMTKVLTRCHDLKCLNLTDCPQLLVPDVFRLCHMTSPKLTTVILACNKNVTDEVVQVLLKSVPNLHSLDISNNDISDAAFLIDTEEQERFHTSNKVLTEKEVSSMLPLAKVNVSGCQNVTGTLVANLIALCGPNLRDVNICHSSIQFHALLYLAGYDCTVVDSLIVDVDDTSSDWDFQLRHHSMDGTQQLQQNQEDLTPLSGNVHQELSALDQASEDTDSNKDIQASVCHESAADIPRPVAGCGDLSREKCQQNCTDTDTGYNYKKCDFAQIRHFDIFDADVTNADQMNSQVQDSEGDVSNCGIRHTSVVKINDVENCDCPCDVVVNANVNVNVSESSCSLTCSGGIVSESDTFKDVHVTDMHQQYAQSAESKELSPLEKVFVDSNSHKDVDVTEIHLFDKDAEHISSDMQSSSSDRQATSSDRQATFSDIPLPNCDMELMSTDFQDANSLQSTQSDVQPISSDVLPASSDVQHSDTSITNDVQGPNMDPVEGGDAPITYEFESIHLCLPEHVKPSVVHHSIEEVPQYLNTVKGDKPSSNRGALQSRRAVKVQRGLRQKYTPNILSLDIRSIPIFRDKHFVNMCLERFFTVNTNVHTLKINWRNLSEECIESITKKTKNLQQICMEECPGVQPKGARIVGQNSPNLRHISLRGLVFIKDRDMLPYLQLKNLESLSLSESMITDATLCRLASQCGPRLKSLDLSWCEEITERGVNAICLKCTNMQVLSLRKCPVSDLSIQLLTPHAHLLTELNMDSANDEIANSLSDTSVVSLAQNLHSLERIVISWNLNLTNASVYAILLYCTKLREADMKGLKRINSDPFLPILSDVKRWRRCQTLLKFKKAEVQKLAEMHEEQYSSDEEYEDLYVPSRSTVYAPNLQFLDLEYCDLVKEDYLAEIVAACRGSLQIIDYYSAKVEPKLFASHK